MTERPILFSAPMVRALLDGTKTQTRRLLNPQPETFDIDGRPCDVGCMLVDGETVPRIWLGRESSGVLTSQNTRFAVGDRLWVKETWRTTERWDGHAPSKIPVGYMPIEYLATPSLPRDMGKTRVAIHMPRWASRLTLTVTDVRVERLQDISTPDAVAEGAPPIHNKPGGDTGNPSHGWISYRDGFQRLWNSINGDGAWEKNPWVVALSFDVHKGNIDA